MASFVSADIGKVADFEKKSQEAINEFNAIKERFEEINTTLLKKWKGEGADAYNVDVSAIMEKVGNIKDTLDALNEAMKSAKDAYMKLDEDLAEVNVNPS